MRLARLFASAVLSLLVASSAAALTGTWTGTYSVTIQCDATTLSSSGAAVLSSDADSTGSGFIGFLVMQGVTIPDIEDCSSGLQVPMAMFVNGQVSGNSVTGEFAMVFADGTLSATTNGPALNGTFSGQDGSGSFNLTQVSNARPSSENSGTYTGSYSAEEDHSQECPNLGRLTYSGALTLDVLHLGRGGFAVGYGRDMKFVVNDGSACTVLDVSEGLVVLSLSIAEDGTYAGFGLVTGHGVLVLRGITGTISPTSITGTAPSGSDKFTFNGTKTGSTGPPVITSFRAIPPAIAAGASTLLGWSTTNATSVTIDNGVGSQPANGTVVVSPRQTTVYTLTALGPAGTATAQVEVFVGEGGAPLVVLTARPPRFVQRANQGGGSDTFTLANIGNASTTVSLTANGSFFTVSPTSIEILARSSQRFTVTGLAQPAGAYEGTVAVTGAGVVAGAEIPVRMLSAAPAGGSVQPRAAVSRAEISTTQGQAGAGSISFTNHGSGTLHAIAVSDVPWITPEEGIVSIGPGQTRAVTFVVDPAKRPLAVPIGAVAGRLSIAFLREGDNAEAPGILGAGSPGGTTTVSVTLVHVVRPGVVPGGPPPLSAGELAWFVSGLANKPTATGDLYVANAAGGSISDLKLYFLGAGGVAQNTTLPAVQSNSTVALPGIVKNVFNAPVATGTMQVRSASAPSVSLVAMQTNASSPAGTYSTSLPIFRSDRGATSGGAIVLSGLLKSSSARTDLFVQEVSGTAGTFAVEFLNASGGVVGSLAAQNIAPFAGVELLDVVPAGAASARITNTSSARVNAYALATNLSTGDAWLSTDSTTDDPSASTWILPIFSAGPSATTNLFMTNRTPAQVNVTVDVVSAGPGRRRAVGTATAGSSVATKGASTLTIGPSQTSSMPVTQTRGYVKLTSAAGAVSAVGRSVANDSYGSGLRAVPVTQALGNGQLRRFSAVDDASSASVSSQAPGTFRSSVALVETANQSATVRVTLNYTFSASALATAHATSSRQYGLSAGQYLLLDDLARDVIGSQRDSFGDLRDMTLDVEVIGGTGRVLAFVQSIDNGSGDMIVRTE